MKTKLKLDELAQLDYRTYLSKIDKEIERAKSFGSTGVIVLSEFKFACGTVAALLVFNNLAGEALNFYKEAKKNRKAEKDFAMGTCYFETAADGTTKLHVNLEDGKAKPSKIKKSGKKIFQRAGLSVDFSGALAQENEDETDEPTPLGKEELNQLEQNSQQVSDKQKIGLIAKKYEKSLADVSQVLLPAIKANKVADAHFQLAKNFYLYIDAFLKEFETLDDKAKQQYATSKDKIAAQKENALRLVAKVKKMLMEQSDVHGSASEVIQKFGQLKKQITDLIQRANGAILSLLK